MSSIIKVDTIQDQDGNNIINENANTITIGKSGDTVTVASGATFVGGGIEWQSSIVTGTTLSAVAGKGYWIDTTSNACTVTLPASASVGDQIIFSDYARNWGTNAVTIDQNSLNFQGYTSPNPEYSTSGQSVSIVYSGATQGWIPTVDDAVTNETPQTVTVDFLVIAGGGGGGTGQNFPGERSGGGGGAGGYRNSYSTESSGGGGSSEASLTFTPGAVYTITVGAFGAGATTDTEPGTTGSNSSISGTGITTITSDGGGAGRGTSTSPSGFPGSSGGSGGGGAASTPQSSGFSGTANQGYAGGDGVASQDSSGGGGGAGGAGQNGQTYPDAGDGGIGVASTITGSSTSRAGGGGGGGGTGGTGVAGGGNGGNTGTSGSAGTVNTGGGGGGGGATGASNDGANGGSGVVILRMADADYSSTTTGSPTVNTNVGGSGETVLIFNGSGSYTA